MTAANHELPSQAETADIETSSDEYATRFAGPAGVWMLGIQERITRRMLADLDGGSILDVGGGHGQLAVPLYHAGYDVTVFGSAPSCRRRVESILDGRRGRFVTGAVIALPFPDRAFDAAISFRLMTHCAAWRTLIGELCRVARRAVVVDYPTSQSVNIAAPALFGAKKRMEGNTRTWTLFRHEDIMNAFAAAGYVLAERDAQFFLPMVLHRALRCRPLSAGLEALFRVGGLTRRWGSPVIVKMVPAQRAA